MHGFGIQAVRKSGPGQRDCSLRLIACILALRLRGTMIRAKQRSSVADYLHGGGFTQTSFPSFSKNFGSLLAFEI